MSEYRNIYPIIETSDASLSGRVYRVDRFTVPAAARGEFLAGFERAHALLRAEEGFIQEFMLQREDGPVWHFVTLVEWANQDASDKAGISIRGMHAQIGFDPATFWKAAGIAAEIRFFTALKDEAPCDVNADGLNTRNA